MGKDVISLKIKPDFRKYFNGNRMFSYEADFFYLTGGRGIGKTTYFDIKSVLNYIKRGDEFVYTRRVIPETKKSVNKFDSIINEKVTIRGYGEGVYEWQVHKKRIGYCIPLSVQQSVKSGMDFSKCTMLIYDEALLPLAKSGSYLPNEVEQLLELISTVFRDRTNYKVFVLGNNASIFNPYYEYFNIPKFTRSYIDKDRRIYAELLENSPALLEAEMQTPLYKLTKGTNYGDYHYENKPLITVSGTIAPKPLYAKIITRLIVRDATLNIYTTGSGLSLFVEHRPKIIEDPYAFRLYDQNGKPNLFHIRNFKGSDLGKLIIERYYINDITFESEIALQAFLVFIDTIH